MASSKIPLISLKDFSKELGQNNNNIYIKEEDVSEEFESVTCNVKDLTSISKNSFDSTNSVIEELKIYDSVNSENKIKNKPPVMKIKFPMMGKINLNNNDKKRKESKLENHKTPELGEISSSQRTSAEGISSKKKHPKAIKGRVIRAADVPFTELEKELYLKPLNNGWKRELVLRNTFKGSIRLGDIYYYAPSGKKLRSRVEIGRFLNENGITNYTIENFTFSKFLIGAGEPLEIKRDANSQGSALPGRKIKNNNEKKSMPNSPKKNTSDVGSVTKFSSKPQSKPFLNGITKKISLTNNLVKETPISNGASADSSNTKPKGPRTSSNKRKPTISHLGNKCKFIKLRDRQNIHPPARYEVMEESDDFEDNFYKVSGSSTKLQKRAIQEDGNRPEEMVVEPDIYLDENEESENVRLNFPFGIDESDDQTTAATPDITLKGPLLSHENLPPIKKKDSKKPKIPLIQFTFEELFKDGGGGSDKPKKKRELSVPKKHSKIRVRSLDELCDKTPRLETQSPCDKTPRVETQSPSLNPVLMNFNINANVPSYLPNYNAGLTSIPTIPIQHHLSFNNNNNGSVPLFVSVPSYTHNNSVDSNNGLLSLPFSISPNSNSDNSVPFQNRVSNFVRLVTPVNSNIIPNLSDGNAGYKNYNETLKTPTSSRNLKHRPLLPRSACTIQGKPFEFVIGSTNTPVLRQIPL